jgi:hypothetical protein
MTKFTRALGVTLLVSIVIANAANAQKSPDDPKFSITIEALQPEVALGSDVEIGIKVANISDDSLTFAYGHHGRLPDGFQFDVRDEQGAMVPKFARSNMPADDATLQLPARPAGSAIPGGIEIEPGKSIQTRAAINDLYRFDRPGKYTIKVSLKTPWSPTINSNVITITVAERDGKADAPK